MFDIILIQKKQILRQILKTKLTTVVTDSILIKDN